MTDDMDLRQIALDLFDDLVVDPESVREAIVATDDAIARAGEHAEAVWKCRALDAVKVIAERRERFTTDAVWALLDRWEVPPPHEPRAMGWVMKSAATAEGWIESTNETSKSTRPEHHRYPCTVWRSRIYREAAA